MKKGNNLIVVDLRSSKPVDAERQKINQMPFEYAHTRKACYQYSWDWAPYMNTLGIWDDIVFLKVEVDCRRYCYIELFADEIAELIRTLGDYHFPVLS